MNKMYVNSISNGSTFEIGDVEHAGPRTKVIAVQQPRTNYKDEDENITFSSFSVFKEPLPEKPVYSPVQKQTINHSPSIHVNRINIIGISTSAIVQIGGLGTIDSEVRVKHIRILPEEQFEGT